MRIAIIIDSLIRGGAERQALYSARELCRRGCDVEVVYYYDEPNGYDKALAGGAKFTFIPKNGTYLRFFLRLRQYLKQGRFDIVHAYKSIACIYGCMAGVLAGVPVVFAGYREQYKLRGFPKLGHRMINKHITGWIVNSQAIGATLTKSLGVAPERIFLVYNGIEPGAFRAGVTAAQARQKLGLPHEAGVVSIIGRLRPEKNHAMFLKVAARVSSERADARFLIIGDGPMEGQLRELAASLGIQDVVYFLGIRNDIADLLAATDVCVVTSPREGLANSLIEAMCAGVPIISTDYRGVDEVLTDNVEGLVVSRDNTQSMADKIVYLLSDGAMREKYGEAGMKRVEKQFSMEAMGENLLRIYKKGIEESRSEKCSSRLDTLEYALQRTRTCGMNYLSCMKDARICAAFVA